MKDLITIGLPSKGRLKDKAISFFNNKGLKILQSGKERNYFGTIENKPNVKIIFLHAKEIIQRLADGTLDIGTDLCCRRNSQTSKRLFDILRKRSAAH